MLELIFKLFVKPNKRLFAAPIISPYVKDKNMRLFVVMESFCVSNVDVPQGTLSDGASIPSMFWSIIGHPFSPPFLAYAIAHDYLYQRAEILYKTNYKRAMQEFRAADIWLYSSMRKQNRKVTSWLFYAAVRIYSLSKFGIWRRFKK